MMIVKTLSGSVYEIDKEASRIRRLGGLAPATVRQGQDGEWRKFLHIMGPTIGMNMRIFWADNSVGVKAAPGCVPATVTNLVAEITDDSGAVRRH